MASQENRSFPVSSATGEATAQRLERAVGELMNSARGLGPELYQYPGEDEWSAMQNLAHVAEFMPFWALRARDVALGQLADMPFGRTPEEWDQRTSAVSEHAADTLEDILESLEAARATAVDALRAIPEDGWTRSGLLEPGGPRMTVAELVQQRLIGHVEAHVRQAADAAAARAPASERPNRSAS